MALDILKAALSMSSYLLLMSSVFKMPFTLSAMAFQADRRSVSWRSLHGYFAVRQHTHCCNIVCRGRCGVSQLFQEVFMPMLSLKQLLHCSLSYHRLHENLQSFLSKHLLLRTGRQTCLKGVCK